MVSERARPPADLAIGPAGLPPLRMGFLELGKPADEPAVAAWQRFLSTGTPPPGAPDYLGEAATVASRANLTGREITMLDYLTMNPLNHAARDCATVMI